LGTREEPRAGDKERGAPGSIEPESASFSGLVETGENLTAQAYKCRPCQFFDVWDSRWSSHIWTRFRKIQTRKVPLLWKGQRRT